MIVAIPQCQEFTPHFTVADLLDLPVNLPTGPVQYELYDGRLIARPPRGDVYYSVNLSFPGALLFDAEQRGLGVALSESIRRAHHLESLDVAWFEEPLPADDIGSHRVLAARTSVPIAVGESLYSVSQFKDYLSAGVQVVWVADPIDQTVTLFRHQGELEILSEADFLAEPRILPGLRMSVREVFAN